MADVQTLVINLYGEQIGTLTSIGGDRSIFAFTDAYIADSNHPTLSLSFKDEFGELLPPQARPTTTSLTPFFSNLLPEGHMRDYLAERAGVKKMREFHLLATLGLDLPGAMTVTSALHSEWKPDEAAADDVDKARQRENVMRFSLAGVQMKFSAISEASGGLTIPVNGAGGSWIVKLPSMLFDRVPENELSMMTLASMIGMDIPEHTLIDPKDISGLPGDIDKINMPAFAIRRFDRGPENERIHIEDFAQVFNVYPSKKYERATYRSIAKVLWIETGANGIAEYIRRLIFNTLIGNADMHLKNWSLIYRDRQTPELAPGYDFVSTIPYIADEYAALKYARQKKMQSLTLDELAYLAAKSGAPETLVIETAKETITKFMEVWDSEATHLPMDQHVRDTIEKHYRHSALLNEI